MPAKPDWKRLHKRIRPLAAMALNERKGKGHCQQKQSRAKQATGENSVGIFRMLERTFQTLFYF